MSSPPAEIPRRALFRAAEVCEIAQLRPYVLRSWESEFPDLGVVRTAGAPRLYRRVDVERVLRIRDLLFVEGLTLAGARRRLEQEETPLVPADDPGLEELLGRDARERLARVREGLRGLLALLSNGGAAGGTSEFSLTEPEPPAPPRRRRPEPPHPRARRPAPARKKR